MLLRKITAVQLFCVPKDRREAVGLGERADVVLVPGAVVGVAEHERVQQRLDGAPVRPPRVLGARERADETLLGRERVGAAHAVQRARPFPEREAPAVSAGLCVQEDVRRVPAAVAADPLALAEQLQSPLGQQPVGLLRLLLADEDVEVFDFALGLAGVERAEGEAVQRQAVDPFVFERGEDGRGVVLLAQLARGDAVERPPPLVGQKLRRDAAGDGAEYARLPGSGKQARIVLSLGQRHDTAAPDRLHGQIEQIFVLAGYVHRCVS